MVTENGTTEHSTSGQRHAHAHLNCHGNSNQAHNRHGAHGGTCSKGQNHGHDKYQCRQEARAEEVHKDVGQIVTGIQLLNQGTHGKSQH